jgi:hypothetical protein
MVTRSEQLQNVFRLYEQEHEHMPASARQACEWGVEKRLLELPKVDRYDLLANEMSRALRDQYATDEKGRRYRINHAVRVTKHGVQMTFWAIMGFAARNHMQMAFTQRRNQIVGDCLQLKTDVDVYNELKKSGEPIQLVLDFSDDVAEREYWSEAA